MSIYCTGPRVTRHSPIVSLMCPGSICQLIIPDVCLPLPIADVLILSGYMLLPSHCCAFAGGQSLEYKQEVESYSSGRASFEEICEAMGGLVKAGKVSSRRLARASPAHHPHITLTAR